jgi:hypothetical protein
MEVGNLNWELRDGGGDFSFRLQSDGGITFDGVFREGTTFTC